jgi:glycosyltransferase involved in cell wall biosynthesis
VATSLILCTKNGGARLGTCLQHLEALDSPPGFELVLVDNGSDDGESRQRLADFAAASRHRVRLIDCDRPGNGAGRNAAIAVATGDILVFIDDDCYAEPRLVRDWEAAIAETGFGYGCGRIARYNAEQSLIGLMEEPEPIRFGPRAYVRRGTIQGSNMVFTRACLSQVGGFDERLGAGLSFSGEDWDMVLRASLAGFSGGYHPAPTVRHDHRRLPEEAGRRLLWYDYGGGAVLAKHYGGPHRLRVAGWLGIELFRMRRWRERRAELLRGFRDFRARHPGPDPSETAWQPA